MQVTCSFWDRWRKVTHDISFKVEGQISVWNNKNDDVGCLIAYCVALAKFFLKRSKTVKIICMVTCNVFDSNSE